MPRLSRLHQLDRLQLLLVGMLVVLGLMTLYSASAADFRRQLLSLLLGVVAYVVAAALDYRRLERFVLPAYGAALLLLLAVHLAGHTALRARRWIPIAGFPLEPSDLSKIVVLVVIARHFALREGGERKGATPVCALPLAAPAMILSPPPPDLAAPTV